MSVRGPDESLRRALMKGDLKAASRAKSRGGLDKLSASTLWQVATWDAPQSGRDAWAVLDWLCEHAPHAVHTGPAAWAMLPAVFNNGDLRTVTWLAQRGHLDAPCPWGAGEVRRVRAHVTRGDREVPGEIWDWLLSQPIMRQLGDAPGDPWLLSLMESKALGSPVWVDTLTRLLEASLRLTWEPTHMRGAGGPLSAWDALAHEYAIHHSVKDWDVDELEPETREAMIHRGWEALVVHATAQGVPEEKMLADVLDGLVHTPLGVRLLARQRELQARHAPLPSSRSCRLRS